MREIVKKIYKMIENVICTVTNCILDTINFRIRQICLKRNIFSKRQYIWVH